jgi:hypothetical protein
MNNDKFIEASRKERFCLNNLIPILRTNNWEWTTYMTDIYSYDTYDCLLQAYKDGVIKRRFIIEFKLRDSHYGDLIFETKKLKSLKEVVYDDITDILYITTTPNGTYIFNISKLIKEDKLKVSTIMANKATMSSRTDKIKKSVYMLDCEWAKYIPYKFSNVDYMNSIKKVEQQNNKHKARYDMFNYLINKD